mmetsp:Transcript_22967/g.35443  ORF Transcript_22967/g.35443 Transcript_22967/m.35443 type:complete len:216 (+) Transcript_22967:1896-2543(+)
MHLLHFGPLLPEPVSDRATDVIFRVRQDGLSLLLLLRDSRDIRLVLMLEVVDSLLPLALQLEAAIPLLLKLTVEMLLLLVLEYRLLILEGDLVTIGTHLGSGLNAHRVLAPISSIAEVVSTLREGAAPRQLVNRASSEVVGVPPLLTAMGSHIDVAHRVVLATMTGRTITSKSSTLVIGLAPLWLLALVARKRPWLISTTAEASQEGSIILVILG